VNKRPIEEIIKDLKYALELDNLKQHWRPNDEEAFLDAIDNDRNIYVGFNAYMSSYIGSLFKEFRESDCE
jgi:hypothetical protein